MKVFLTIIILFISINITSAQVTQQWVARYNGSGNLYDQSRSIALDESGNIYVTGTSLGSGTNWDFATVKYNSSGVKIWDQIYNGTTVNSDDGAESIALDDSGNVYVTGYSEGNGTGSDYLTIKYNSSGVQQWMQRYSGPGNSYDLPVSIVVDDSGNSYVTGWSQNSQSYVEYTTIKYNSSGVQQWVQKYGGPVNSSSFAHAIALDDSNNVYVTGESPDNGTGYDYATIKYNSSGVQQWVQRYNGTGNLNDAGTSIAIGDSGNVYVTGFSSESGRGNDYATIKYSSSGIPQWTKIYNGTGNSNDGASSIVIDNSGSIYVTGYSSGIGSGSDYATIKYNTSGVQQWVKRYNGPANSDDGTNSITIDDSDNVYVTGYSFGTGTETDFATIKYNSSGDSVWVKRYNGPGNSSDIANQIAVDGSDNVYVTGTSTGSGTNIDYATIKYSQLITGISQTSSILPEKFSLSQNYPNPFNPSTTFEIGIPKSGFVSLKIYNMLGKEVSAVVNSELNPGTYKYEFDASDLASGVYLYKLSSGNFSDTKQMILIR